jgi:DNA processing protein
VSGCDACLARAWLLARLASNLEHLRGRIDSVLELKDGELIEAVGGEERAKIRTELAGFEPTAARERAARAGVETICRCDPRYPRRLQDLPAPPAVLHAAGGLERFLTLVEGEPVALVGARRASPYGLDLAGSLGRGLAVAGLTVLSGMALGVDSAAHAGALAAPGPTVAVLPGGADRAYPAGKRALRRQIVETGAAVSELPPGAQVWRWMFPARNRIIAALADMTVVVAARVGSGAMLTIGEADRLGRLVGGVPGQVTAPLSWGPHMVIKLGGELVRGADDVLTAVDPERSPPVPRRESPDDPQLAALFEALADGYELPDALTQAGFDAERGLAALAALEMGGYVRRQAGGRYCIVP